MIYSYINFLKIFDRKTTDINPPVLFEPLVNQSICEQLIWRRGKNLWDTPENYFDTLLSLRERTKSDVITLDMRRFTFDENERLLNCISSNLSSSTEIKAAMLCDSNEQQDLAESCESVCSVGGFTSSTSPKKLPFIRMDGNIDSAVSEAADGYYSPSHAETVFQNYSDRIAILGGLGLDWLNGTTPTEVHSRCENLYKLTGNRRYAIGSGGFGEETDFLNFISLLSIYIRYR